MRGPSVLDLRSLCPSTHLKKPEAKPAKKLGIRLTSAVNPLLLFSRSYLLTCSLLSLSERVLSFPPSNHSLQEHNRSPSARKVRCRFTCASASINRLVQPTSSVLDPQVTASLPTYLQLLTSSSGGHGSPGTLSIHADLDMYSFSRNQGQEFVSMNSEASLEKSEESGRDEEGSMP